MADDIRDDLIDNSTGNTGFINPLTGGPNILRLLTPKIPDVKDANDLQSRHQKIDGAYAKAQKDYMDASTKAHAMVASGTNYSHDALHDLASQMGASQSTMQHLRAMKAQLPPLPAAPSTVSPAFKARMAAQGMAGQTATEALDNLAKAKQAEAPATKK